MDATIIDHTITGHSIGRITTDHIIADIIIGATTDLRIISITDIINLGITIQAMAGDTINPTRYIVSGLGIEEVGAGVMAMMTTKIDAHLTNYCKY